MRGFSWKAGTDTIETWISEARSAAAAKALMEREVQFVMVGPDARTPADVTFESKARHVDDPGVPR